jgi:hypothetical protein
METNIEVNRCRFCSTLIEAWFAYCERHAEGHCGRCGAAPEETCKEGCPNRVDESIQGRA